MVKALEIVGGVFTLISVLFYNLNHTNSFYVTTIIACVLFVLALIAHRKEINAAIESGKTNIQITPSKDIHISENGNETPTMGVSITNLSNFAVTISKVGFNIKESPLKAFIPIPLLYDNGPYPRRLEPRSQFKLYIAPNMVKSPEFSSYDEFYVTTDCGKTFSKGLEGIHEMLK